MSGWHVAHGNSMPPSYASDALSDVRTVRNHAPTMETHALAILTTAESWNWPHVQGKFSEKFKTITPKLLSAVILESQTLGGIILDQFWVVVGQCHPRLAENGTSRLPLSEHIFQFISLSSYNPSPYAFFIT